eukprot:650499-Amphidinium_carterae.1
MIHALACTGRAAMEAQVNCSCSRTACIGGILASAAINGVLVAIRGGSRHPSGMMASMVCKPSPESREQSEAGGVESLHLHAIAVYTLP